MVRTYEAGKLKGPGHQQGGDYGEDPDRDVLAEVTLRHV
jgi:hypothetical protein